MTLASWLMVIGTAYFGVGLLWMLRNLESDFTRRVIEDGGSRAAMLLGMILAVLLWPIWFATAILIRIDARRTRSKGH